MQLQHLVPVQTEKYVVSLGSQVEFMFCTFHNNTYDGQYLCFWSPLTVQQCVYVYVHGFHLTGIET
jgi:hypothetical protein